MGHKNPIANVPERGWHHTSPGAHVTPSRVARGAKSRIAGPCAPRF